MDKKRIGLEAKELRFSGSQVTWAGEYPWVQPGALCFASDDGSICVKDKHGHTLLTTPGPPNLESINGVAFTDRMMAVSTPAKVVVAMRAPTPNSRDYLFDQGAHGVITTRRGDFMAPMGLKGVMQLTQLSVDEVLRNDFRPDGLDIYFYRMASVGVTSDRTEIVACAARRHGLVIVSIDSRGRPAKIGMNQSGNPYSVEQMDIVDVCPLPSTEHPFAVVALGIDNTLHFTFDIRNESPMVGLRFQEMRGTAYTLLTSRGHLFVLTSEEFYILPDLGARLLSNEHYATTVGVLRHPIAAFDCSIAYDEVILLIREGAVTVYEVSQLLPQSTVFPVESPRLGDLRDADAVDEMTPALIRAQRDSLKFFALESVVN